MNEKFKVSLTAVILQKNAGMRLQLVEKNEIKNCYSALGINTVSISLYLLYLNTILIY